MVSFPTVPTLPYLSSAGNGRITAAVNDFIIEPKFSKRDGTVSGVVLLHGAFGTTGNFWNPSSSLANFHIATYLGGYFPTVAMDMGDSWGNATALTRIANARTYLQGTLGAKSGGIYLFGYSMGGIAAAKYAAANPTNVRAIAGIVPGFNMQQLRVSNQLSLRGSIDAAWGVTYPAALPAGANPSDNPSALAGIPYMAWGASDDPVWPAVNATDFLGAMGGTYINVGAYGHSETAMQQVDPKDIVAHFLAHP